jgi:hypothetical protein
MNASSCLPDGKKVQNPVRAKLYNLTKFYTARKIYVTHFPEQTSHIVVDI